MWICVLQWSLLATVITAGIDCCHVQVWQRCLCTVLTCVCAVSCALRSTQRLATTGIQREGERRRPFDRLTVLIDSASATTVPPARTFESEVNLWPPLDTGAIFRRFCIAVYRMHCIIRTGFSCSFQQALDHQNWTTWWDTTPLRVHTLVMVNSFSKRIAPRICSSAHAGLHRPRRNIVRAIGVWI